MACLLLNDVDLYPGPEKEVRPNCYKSIYWYALCRTVISVAYLDSTYWILIHKKWKYLCHSNTGFKAKIKNINIIKHCYPLKLIIFIVTCIY